MNTLIVAGLLGFGLLAILIAVFLAMDENKIPATGTSSSNAESPKGTMMQPAVNSAPGFVAEQRLPALREEAHVAIITTQFSELTAQLRVLHEQAREIEQRLRVLSDIAGNIERNQSSVSIEETKEYRLLEPANGVHTS